MPWTADRIRANAAILSAAQSRIRETVRLRSHSASARAEWEDACAKFHERFDQFFFPGGETGWSEFLANSEEGIELALLFLEVDQITFRSGYHKQIVWDRLKRVYLTPDELARIEEIALVYLHRRVRREFWNMVNFMRLRASASLWQRVETLAADPENNIARKARWLLLARRNVPVQRWIRTELSRSGYIPGYRPCLDF